MPATLSPILMQATSVLAVSGRGAVLVDVDGREYLDFTAGIGVTSTGHCHPRVVAAAQEQVARLIHGQYTTVMHQPLRRLVARLGEVLPVSGCACRLRHRSATPRRRLRSGVQRVVAQILWRHATGRRTAYLYPTAAGALQKRTVTLAQTCRDRESAVGAADLPQVRAYPQRLCCIR